MKRLAGHLMLASLPVLIMAGANLAVDPANLFRRGAEAEVARQLAAGEAMAGIDVIDTRVLQREYVRRLAAAPDVGVLGSSRAFQIRGASFSGLRFWNHAMPGASLEDFLAIAGLYRLAGLQPRAMVLVLDPWILNQYNGQRRWRSLGPEYEYMASVLGTGRRFWLAPPQALNRYLELFSPAYFQESVQRLTSAPAVRVSPHVVAPLPGNQITLLPDGSWHYGPEMRSRSPEEAARQATLYAANKPIYSLGAFRRLDPNAQHKLDVLTRFLLNGGTRVTLVLAPYHPLVFDLISHTEQYHAVIDAEQYFRAWAAQVGVPLAGSYDPARAECTPADFFDGMHPRERCMNRILSRLP